jgi:RND family efflux transporter MFP subunit
MRYLRTRWSIAAAVVILLAAPGAWLMARGTTPGEDGSLVAQVKKADFKVVVNTSGELRALKFVQVQGPGNGQQAEVWQMKISSIVPEGTVVKEGDVVAELDKSTIGSKLSEFTLALQKAEAQFEQAQLDSTLNLSKAREEIRTATLALEEKRIAKDQSQYEAPSVRRQAEIDFEKADRGLEQLKIDYKTKVEQAQAKMREVGADVQRSRNKVQIAQQVMEAFTVRAPAPGMVIYVKEWNGRKKGVGSQVNAWDPTIATLPDLSKMESITYVNEIDVRKIAIGQRVSVTLDSDPSKRLTGKVTAVANVGEQRPNTDAKVFEVKVLVDQADSTLRPGMTTGNAIETMALERVLSVPLEAVTTEDDVPYVYKQRGAGVVRQEITTGAMNDDAVVVTGGLEEGDRVLLTMPPDREGVETIRLPGSGNVPKPAAGDTAAGRTVPVRPDTTPVKGAPAAPAKQP